MKSNGCFLIAICKNINCRYFYTCIYLLVTSVCSKCYAQNVITGGVNYGPARTEASGRGNVLPDKFQVSVSPNPAINEIRIFYELPFASHVVLKLYDTLGKEIATLVNADSKAGYFSKEFNVSALRKGMYFYQITMRTNDKGSMQAGKIIVVK